MLGLRRSNGNTHHRTAAKARSEHGSSVAIAPRTRYAGCRASGGASTRITRGCFRCGEDGRPPLFTPARLSSTAPDSKVEDADKEKPLSRRSHHQPVKEGWTTSGLPASSARRGRALRRPSPPASSIHHRAGRLAQRANDSIVETGKGGLPFGAPKLTRTRSLASPFRPHNHER